MLVVVCFHRTPRLSMSAVLQLHLQLPKNAPSSASLLWIFEYGELDRHKNTTTLSIYTPLRSHNFHWEVASIDTEKSVCCLVHSGAKYLRASSAAATCDLARVLPLN